MMLRQTVFGAVSAAGMALALAVPATAQEDDKGMLEFNNACRTCHSLNEGDNRLGPNLHGIVGRQAGAAEGFQYSPAVKGAKIAWTEENLDKFITNPEGFLPGNTMKPFAGIDNAESRKAIIDYLKNPK